MIEIRSGVIGLKPGVDKVILYFTPVPILCNLKNQIKQQWKAMKSIVAGASAFFAVEVVRQSMSNPMTTSVYAVARRPVEVPKSKLHSIVVQDDFMPLLGCLIPS